MTYHVLAHYHARAEEADRVAELLGALVTASRQEPGCESYSAARDVLDPTHFIIAEAYGSEADFAVHRRTPHFQSIGVGQIIPLLQSRRVVGGELSQV